MITGPEWLLIGAVATVGVLHTVVPDHWVPITLIARQQGWTKWEVARAALIAGTGHTVSTLLIGLVVWLAGVAFATKFGNSVSTVSSIALIAFGGLIAVSSLRELQSAGRHGHSHAHGHRHGPEPNLGFHGLELARITTNHELLELSIYETGQPPHFRLSGHSGDRVWLQIKRIDGAQQRFEFVNRGEYWESPDEIPEPHAFDVTVSVAHGDHVQSYNAAFVEHDHDHGEHGRESDDRLDDRLYVPNPAGTTALAKHAHAHRHGRSVHMHLHDHGSDTWHRDTTTAGDPPVHEHRHKRPLQTTLLLILGSSPMVEGIPAFFAAGKYGPALIGVMAVVFALTTIATYIVLCVSSVAGLQRVKLGPLERYGEVLSGTFIVAVGLVFLVFPIL
jgi:nickel/cobalt transporter (NicO) family protein